jgi:hypothetical protein
MCCVEDGTAALVCMLSLVVPRLPAAAALLLLLLLHRYNAHVVLDAAGSTAASYRKVHLFDVDVPNGPVLMESRTTAPGDKVIDVLCTYLVGCWAPSPPADQADAMAQPSSALLCLCMHFRELWRASHISHWLGAQGNTPPSSNTCMQYSATHSFRNLASACRVMCGTPTLSL